MERLRKRLVGVSDGFDLSSDTAQIVIMATAMFNEIFIKQLRDKVLRGMRGAAERGTVLDRPRFGYRIVPQLDSDGRPMFHNKEKPIRIAEICPEDMVHVLKAASLFVAGASYGKIARMFNDQKIGGKTSWGGSTIRQMLACPLYIGVAIFNRTRTVFDVETGEFTIAENDHKDWIVKKMPHLGAWSIELWRQVRRRAWEVRLASPHTGKKKVRNKAYPSTLFSGALFCKHCRVELLLIRSTERSKQIGCMNGTKHVHECPLHNSKSVRVIEECLLGWVEKNVLNPECIKSLVEPANRHLAKLAERPRHDTRPLQQKIRGLEQEEQALVEFVMKHQDRHDLTAYLSKGDALHKKLDGLRQQLRDLNTANADPPRPLVLADVLARLEDLRSLLNTNITESATILRELFGVVYVHQVKQPGQHGADWFGEFRANVLKFMASASRRKNYPDASTWEFLYARNWIVPKPETIKIVHTPQYVLFAETFREMHSKGVSVNAMAAAVGMAWQQANGILKFALNGTAPASSPGKGKGRGMTRHSRYKAISSEVLRRRDTERHSFKRIAQDLGCGQNTVQRAYDYGHPDAARLAIDGRKAHHRGCVSHLSAKAHARIRNLLAAGRHPELIAKAVGCCKNTVWNVKKKIKQEAALIEIASQQTMASGGFRTRRPERKSKRS